MAVPDQFDSYSWHDNSIHGFRIIEGTDGCSGELVLDIDYIVEWLPPQNACSSFQFRIAPADLIFHEVTGLVISVDYASCSAALQPMTIHQIHREIVTYANGYVSFAWKIECNSPNNSFISFHAPTFTQCLRVEPITSGAQYLAPSLRKL